MKGIDSDAAMSQTDDDARTRAAYDTVAADYAELLRDELASKPLDRAMLAAFAELISADGGGRVADVGCGPGRIAGHLRSLGLDVFGIDLSPEMIAVARRDHPELPFKVGTMAALDLDDGALAGVVAWYSVIHTPPADRPGHLAELARVLRPGGRLLLAFQVGDESVRLDAAYGHAIDLDVRRLRPDAIEGELTAAGCSTTARLVAEPVGQERHPQAYLLAQRTGGSPS